MRLSLQNFSTMVESMAATAQSTSAVMLDVSVGSVMRALFESSAAIGLWLQYLILQTLAMTRLSSSTGADADSWVADFGMQRLPAAAAEGVVTMTSFNPGAQGAVINTGMSVRLSDGTQSFTVIDGPYVRPLGQATVDVKIRALSAGTLGNVQPGTINILGSAIPGIDTVSNASALSGGMEAESDSSLRLRFVDYINTRAQATEQALVYAAKSVGINISAVVIENSTAAGAVLPGNIHIIVDDGTGAPGANLLTKVADAVDRVRPVGTTITVSPPVALVASIAVTLAIADNADETFVTAAAIGAIEAYIDGLPVGQSLPYSKLISVLYSAATSIENVINLRVDGGQSDLGGGVGQVVRCGKVTVDVVVS